MTDPSKVMPVLMFEGGDLHVKQSGYGANNGDGHLSFYDDDLDFADEPGKPARVLKLPKSELIAIRDFLNTQFPPALAAAAAVRGEEEVLPMMQAAFRTSVTNGPDRIYEMRFLFNSLTDLHQAENEWINLTQPEKK